MYVFKTELDEQPYAVWDGEIKYQEVEKEEGIRLYMSSDNDIDFSKGIEGFGYDTSDIKDYDTLLAFLQEHYDEIEESEEASLFTRRELVDELMDICKEKINIQREILSSEEAYKRALLQIRNLAFSDIEQIKVADIDFRRIVYTIANEVLKKYESN